MLSQFSGCDKQRKQAQVDPAELESYDNFLKIADSLVHHDPLLVIETAKKIVEKGERIGNWNKIANAIQLMGAAYFNIEKSDSALYFLYQAKSFEDQITDKYIWYKNLNEIGRNYRNLGNLDSARHYFELANQIAIHTDDLKLKMASANNLAMILSDAGYTAQAYNQHLNSLQYADSLKDYRNKAIVLNNLALIDLNTGNLELAEERFREAIRLNREYNRIYDLSMNYGNLALVFQEKALYDSALLYNNKVIEIAREKGFVRDLARALTNSANVLIKMNQLDKAREYLIEGRNLCKQHNILVGLYFTGRGLYEIEFTRGNYAAALSHLDELGPVIEQLGDGEMETGLLLSYAETYHKLQQHQKAYTYLLRHQKMADSLRELANTNLVHELQARYESEKKQMENNQLRIENQAQQQQVRLLNIIILVVGIALFTTLLFILFQILNRRKLKKLNSQLSVLNREINSKNIDLSQANQTKDKLFSVIAHDLKSPFNALIGILEIIIRDGKEMTETEKQDLLDNLYKQTLQTYATTENLLQWAMSKRNLITANMEEFNLYKAVVEEVDFLEGRAAEKGITIQNDLLHDTSLNSDPQLVRNILRNLVYNSIKFSTAGKRIRIEEEHIDGHFAIVISDEGKGMSEEKIAKVFSNEFIESEKGTQNEKGTGLGLQMVREFAKVINAQLRIESELNKGTKVLIIFPDNQA